MKAIKAQKVPKSEISVNDLLARFCYSFPQYTFAQAQRLPYRRVVQMLKVARKEEARKMYELMQVVAAPHSRKGSGIKKVLEYYKGIMEGKNG